MVERAFEYEVGGKVLFNGATCVQRRDNIVAVKRLNKYHRGRKKHIDIRARSAIGQMG